MLVFDRKNVTTPALDFRVEAELDRRECGLLGLTGIRALEITFGGAQGALVGETEPAAQELGSVRFPDDGRRLVAYPHGMQHRMGAVEPVDKSAPGYLDVLELWLVDPHYRVCSTRNVPPQRHDWWLDAILPSQTGSAEDAGCRWPRSLHRSQHTRSNSLSRSRRLGAGRRKGRSMSRCARKPCRVPLISMC